MLNGSNNSSPSSPASGSRDWISRNLRWYHSVVSFMASLSVDRPAALPGLRIFVPPAGLRVVDQGDAGKDSAQHVAPYLERLDRQPVGVGGQILGRFRRGVRVEP